MTGSFVRVACGECSNEQIIFNKASTTVTCRSCDAVLAEPTGGLADVMGEVVEVVEGR